MKNRIAPLAITAFAMVAMSSTAPAAILAQWIQKNFEYTDVEPEPWNIGANVTVSKLTLHGSIHQYTETATKAVYTGWSTTLDYNNYIGFTITPDEGFQMELTEWKTSVLKAGSGAGTAIWGYRIDNDSDGTFDTQWEMLTSVSSTILCIESLDITTSGTVEFGFFATSESESTPVYWSPTAFNSKNTSDLTGTVAAVPEPSAALLACFGGLAAFRRRR